MDNKKSVFEKEIIELYEGGLSMNKIGKKFGINPSKVMKILDENNVKKRTKGGIYELDESKVIDYYKSGMSSTKIGEKYNVSCNTIINVLKKYNIKRNNIYHNLTLDENYWECIDTYDKAYFLGFLITDGNVMGNFVRLQLSSKDQYILEKFAEKTHNTNLIHEDKRKLSAFNVKRHKWVEDLKKYGVIPNKTDYTYLPEINNVLMSHLIRGLIDGDGWITYKGHAIGFCGSEKLVTQVRDFLHQTLNVYKVKVIKKYERLWMIVWHSLKDIKKIGEYMYKNKQDCFLERKYRNYCTLINANTEVISGIAKGSETP